MSFGIDINKVKNLYGGAKDDMSLREAERIMRIYKHDMAQKAAKTFRGRGINEDRFQYGIDQLFPSKLERNLFKMMSGFGKKQKRVKKPTERGRVMSYLIKECGANLGEASKICANLKRNGLSYSQMIVHLRKDFEN